MAKITNISEISNLLYNELKVCNWHDLLKTNILSEDFNKILKYLLDSVREGRRFTPPMKYIFNPFYLCPYEDLKVIFIADEPYNDIGVSDGLAFSCQDILNKEVPLRVIHKSIITTVYDNKKRVSEMTPDLRVWAEQGVLLLNSSLTADIERKGKHYEVWKPFISYLLDMLNTRKKNLVYVFFGKNARQFAELIDDENNFVEILDFPDKREDWNCKNVFNNINEYLLKNDKIKIVW